MKYYVEESLRDFEFWSQAKQNAAELTDVQLDRLEFILEECYPDGMSDTQINDIMWHDFDWVKEMLGISDEEEEERDPWQVKSIVWDTDGEDPKELELPTEVEVPGDVEEDEIADWLSDEYGYCVESYALEREE